MNIHNQNGTAMTIPEYRFLYPDVVNQPLGLYERTDYNHGATVHRFLSQFNAEDKFDNVITARIGTRFIRPNGRVAKTPATETGA